MLPKNKWPAVVVDHMWRIECIIDGMWTVPHGVRVIATDENQNAVWVTFRRSLDGVDGLGPLLPVSSGFL